jgi:Tol biopolymer transport system component
LYDLGTKAKQQLLPPMTTFAYAFWGVTFALSPDRKQLIYASADEIGFIDILSGKRTPLQALPVFQTNAGWVWTPDVAWSPDMRLIAATLHSPPPNTSQPESSHAFAIWAINAAGGYSAPVVPDSGMFANPVWAKQGRIAYAQARLPQQSADSQYDLWVMNADGSNKQRVFPLQGEAGMLNPQAAWSAEGRQLIVLLDGNIYLVDAAGKGVSQLTADGGGTLLRWR